MPIGMPFGMPGEKRKNTETLLLHPESSMLLYNGKMGRHFGERGIQKQSIYLEVMGINQRKKKRSYRRRARGAGLFLLLLLFLAAAGYSTGFLPLETGKLFSVFGIRPPGTQTAQNNYADDGAACYDYRSGLSFLTPCCFDADPSGIPEYDGEDYVILNDGIPSFAGDDLSGITGEYYSALDALGRCGPAAAMLERSMMPTQERGPVGESRPSGWVQRKYEGIIDSTPPYLYNRCHLIAYALTGQNANERNLITGTRYMNAVSMLPWEIRVMRYLDNSPDHVFYRVTPCFRDKELVARGVEMEAWSVEDGGRGLCFHVFVYNYQPGIQIDYAGGKSWIADDRDREEVSRGWKS